MIPAPPSGHRTGGPAALSLRDATRHAGVSPSAAYRHFADREQLLQAIARRIQDDMAERMRAARATAGRLTEPQIQDAAARVVDTAIRGLNL